MIIQQAIAQYLTITLGIEPQFKKWSKAASLPHLMRAAYDFSQITILKQPFLLFVKTGEDALSPAALAKHLSWLEEKTGYRGVLGINSLESFTRKRLIEYKVPFIVPGNQLYLPDLGIDLREHFKKLKVKSAVLSPQAQLVLLAKLLRRPDINTWTATGLAESLNTTKMTMGRAIEDLEDKGLIQIVPEGRNKPIEFIDQGKALWKKAFPVLASPVYKRIYLEEIGNLTSPAKQDITPAGISALSQISMIAGETRQVYALSRADWNRLRSAVTPIPAPDAPIELEIWRYDPKLLGSNEAVDHLSLALSLAHEKDERIEQAIGRILEEFLW